MMLLVARIFQASARRIVVALVLSFASSLLLTVGEATAELRGQIELVAQSGAQAPGNSNGVTLQSVDYAGAAIGDNGTVAFSARLSDNNVGVFTGNSPATISRFAQIGQAAPGAPGDTFQTTSLTPAVANFGSIAHVAMTGTLTGPDVDSTNNEGIWGGASGASVMYMREGATTPLSGVRFGAIVPADYPAPVNINGETTFQTTMRDSSGNPISGTAIWSTVFSQPQLVARTNAGPVPGLAMNSTFTSLGTPGLASNGSLVFSGSFHNPSGPVVDGTGIWFQEYSPSLQRPIAMTGMAAAGTAPGVTFQNVSFAQTSTGTSVSNDFNGSTTFFGTLTGPGVVPNVDDQGVWYGSDVITYLVARTGEAVPGVPGATFTSFSSTGFSSNVLATISGPGVTAANDTGLWRGTGQYLHEIVRNGDTVTDNVDPPVLVSGLDHFVSSASGSIVFQSTAGGPILGEKPNGAMTVVARPGDSVVTGFQESRTIQSLTLLDGGYSGEHGSPMDNYGNVAFTATFTDGSSAVLISHAVAVPEPSTIVLGAVAFLSVLFMRARKLKLDGENPA